MKIKISLVYIVIVLFLSAIIIWYINKPKYPEYISNMNISGLWKDSLGENITIAFLDSGMHPDLVEIYGDRVVSPYDFVIESEAMIDYNGHGTEMICIATCNYEDTGIYGIAPKSEVMPLRIFDSNGDTTDERIKEAIHYAVDNGADIINMSFGSYEDSVEVEEAIDYAITNHVFVICSAGDLLNVATAFPARYANTISVGNLVDFINGVNYADIDIFIYGEEIESLRYSETQQFLVSKYERGSSVSTAILSGIIAIKIHNMSDSMRSVFLGYMIDRNTTYDLEDIVDY